MTSSLERDEEPTEEADENDEDDEVRDESDEDDDLLDELDELELSDCGESTSDSTRRATLNK